MTAEHSSVGSEMLRSGNHLAGLVEDALMAEINAGLPISDFRPARDTEVADHDLVSGDQAVYVRESDGERWAIEVQVITKHLPKSLSPGEFPVSPNQLDLLDELSLRAIRKGR